MRNEEVSPHIRPSCLKYQDTCIYIKYKIINHKNVHIIEYSIYVISNCDLAFFPDAWVGGHTFLSTQFLPDCEKKHDPLPMHQERRSMYTYGTWIFRYQYVEQQE